MGENFNCYLLILSQAEVGKPMIFGLVRNQGANCPKVEPWNLKMTHMSVPPVSIEITNVIQESFHEEAVNEEKGKNYQSCINVALLTGSEIILFRCEQ